MTTVCVISGENYSNTLTNRKIMRIITLLPPFLSLLFNGFVFGRKIKVSPLTRPSSKDVHDGWLKEIAWSLSLTG